MQQYKLTNLNFPSLCNSILGKILEMKRIEELLNENNDNNGSSFKPKLFKKTLESRIVSLKAYGRALNSYISTEINKERAYSLIAMHGNSTTSKNSLSKPNKEAFVPKTISSNNSIFVEKGSVKSELGLEIPLPLELYPNVNHISETNRILGLNLNRVIKHMNIFSKFDSELATYQNVGYRFKNVQNHSIKNINSILESTFSSMCALIGKPYLYHGPNKVELRLDFYRGKSTNKGIIEGFNFDSANMNPSHNEKLSLLGDILIDVYNKPVEVELNRLHVPFTNSTILSKILGQFGNVRKYNAILFKLLRVARFKKPTNLNRQKDNKTLADKATKSMIPAFLSGTKIKIGGRLLTQGVVPRRTVSIFQRGCLARGKANFVNTARFTNKNKRGAYSITVSIANVFG